MTLIIAHRANLSGPDDTRENSLQAIRACLDLGLDVEIDVQAIHAEALVLGHSPLRPQDVHRVPLRLVRNQRVWCHAKNLQAMHGLLAIKAKHCFLHDSDDAALASSGQLWTARYPQVLLEDGLLGGPVADSLLGRLVSVELGRPNPAFDYSKLHGICTDYPLEWQRTLSKV